MKKDTLIITLKEMQHELGVSRPTIWRLRRDKILPNPVYAGDMLLGWRRSSIEEWLIESQQMEVA